MTVKLAPQRMVLAVVLFAFAPLSIPADSAGQHMLWRVQSNSTVMYLLGSVHALRPEDYPLAKAYERAYVESDRVMLEINPLQDTPETIQRLSVEMGIVPDGGSLKSFLTEKNYQRTMLLAKNQGINTVLLDRFEPWLAALTVIGLQMQRAGFQLMIGVDNHFSDRAQADGKPLLGLETADYQISLFDGLTAETQEAFLLQALEEAADFETEMIKLVELWHSGDVAALARLSEEEMLEYPEVHENILLQRNRNWIPKLTRQLREGGSVLVIVGSLHLVGEEGVVRLLEKRGYKVERL